jgi:hypothetical protein
MPHRKKHSARPLNEYMQKVKEAKKNGRPSFEHKGKKYVRHLITTFKKA